MSGDLGVVALSGNVDDGRKEGDGGFLEGGPLTAEGIATCQVGFNNRVWLWLRHFCFVQRIR